MTKISSIYKSKLPYQWEAGNYNAIRHSEVLQKVKPDNDPACLHCGHDKSRHKKQVGACKGVSRFDGCACTTFQAASAAGRKRIAAAQRVRWAKVRAAKK
jgi:hypothetical protein